MPSRGRRRNPRCPQYSGPYTRATRAPPSEGGKDKSPLKWNWYHTKHRNLSATILGLQVVKRKYMKTTHRYADHLADATLGKPQICKFFVWEEISFSKSPSKYYEIRSRCNLLSLHGIHTTNAIIVRTRPIQSV